MRRRVERGREPLGREVRDGATPGADAGLVARIVAEWRTGSSVVTLAIVGAWAIFAVVHLALSQLDGVDRAAAIHFAAVALVGCGISLLIARSTRRADGDGAPLATIVIASLGGGVLLWMADVLVQTSLQDTPVALRHLDAQFLGFRLNLPYFCLLYLVQTVGCALLDASHSALSRERQLTEARLAALRYQLNPHFVYNSLNAVAALVADTGERRAIDIVARLSEFMRIALDGDPGGMTSLAAELELVEAYLGVEALRFEDRLRVVYDCDPGLADAIIPDLILQPIVENAVKHAVAPSREPVTVSILASTDGARIVLRVADDAGPPGAARPARGHGVGLANVSARLAALYGRSARLETGRSGAGYVATVSLPLRVPDDRRAIGPPLGAASVPRGSRASEVAPEVR